MKSYRAVLSIITLLILTMINFSSASLALAQQPPPGPDELEEMRYELIAQVNQLRASYGLGPLTPDPILMQVVQSHTLYQASIGQVTHYSANGSRPFQRALAAGYWIAGDLSQNGWYSENIIGGSGGLTPKQAVQAWTGDGPHLNTMIGPNYLDIGAGVASDGERLYFTIDTAKPANGPVEYTPPPGLENAEVYVYLQPVVVVEPDEDGSITHTVHTGETLWTIAAAYEKTVDEVAQLNQMSPEAWVYPGDTLVIQLGITPTPTRPPTSTPAPTRPTNTARPKSSWTPEGTPGAGQAGTTSFSSATLVVIFLTLGIFVMVLGFAARKPESSGPKSGLNT